MLAFLILLPLAGLMLMNLPILGGLKKVGLAYALLLAVGQVCLAAFASGDVLNRATAVGDFLKLDLHADDLARVMLASIGIVVLVTVLLCRSMVEGANRRSHFTSLLLVAMIGMNGLVLVQDLFSLYVFLEITSVASFILIAFERGKGALEGAFKYVIMSAVATTLMLAGIALFMMLSGGVGFDLVKDALGGGNVFAKVALGAFLCGLFIKGGLVPFHGWLPDAYSAAPAPVSVLLAGVATKASGIYALVRLAGGFDIVFGQEIISPISAQAGNLLLLAGAVSIVVGALAALGQSNMKRLLAYSSISQVGYIVLALGARDPLGLALWGAIFHLFNHSVFKTLLFVNAAALQQRLGTTEMAGMGGLGARMPYTSVTSILAAMSTAGVPPLSGFWSKLLIIIGLWQGGHHGYAFLAVALSVVTLGYLLIMQRKVFFGQLADGLDETKEASLGVVTASVILAVITVGVGVLPFFPAVLRAFNMAVVR